jgi:hypothetical protein
MVSIDQKVRNLSGLLCEILCETAQTEKFEGKVWPPVDGLFPKRSRTAYQRSVATSPSICGNDVLSPRLSLVTETFLVSGDEN